MSSRQRLLVWLVFGFFFCPVVAWAGESVTTPASQRPLPVWRVLLLAYRQVDVDYTDDSGKQHHFGNKLPDEEVQSAVWSFRQYPSLAYKHSKGEVVIQYDIVYPTRKINSVTKMGKNAWWMSPNDTRIEIDEHAPKGTYDSILVLAPLSNHATGEHVPTGGWGLAIPSTNWSNEATYCTVGDAPVDLWSEPDMGEVWLHEWLHGACAHFAKKGWAMPKGDADAGGTLHRYLVAKVRGEHRQVPSIEPLFVEVAKAVNRITGWWRFTSSLDLNRRFSPATRAANWRALGDSLGLSLPELEQPAGDGFPKIPRKCDSLISPTYWIVEHHPERAEWFPVSCERTGKMATHQFTEDEVWAILCECICDALGVKPEEVTPDSRMIEDLGMN